MSIESRTIAEAQLEASQPDSLRSDLARMSLDLVSTIGVLAGLWLLQKTDQGPLAWFTFITGCVVCLVNVWLAWRQDRRRRGQ